MRGIVCGTQIINTRVFTRTRGPLNFRLSTDRLASPIHLRALSLRAVKPLYNQPTFSTLVEYTNLWPLNRSQPRERAGGGAKVCHWAGGSGGRRVALERQTQREPRPEVVIVRWLNGVPPAFPPWPGRAEQAVRRLQLSARGDEGAELPVEESAIHHHTLHQGVDPAAAAAAADAAAAARCDNLATAANPISRQHGDLGRPWPQVFAHGRRLSNP